MSKSIKVNKKMLDEAATRGIVNKDQVESLYFFLNNYNGLSKENSRFSLILYYIGGFTAILAMSLFMSLSFSIYGPTGVLIFVSCLFIGALACEKKLSTKGYPRAAGISVAFALVLVPLIVFIIQYLMGMHDYLNTSDMLNENYQNYHRYIKAKWIYMEIITLIVGVVLMYKYRYPFVMFPFTITLWYLSMDIGVYFFSDDYFSFNLRRDISLLFGGVLTLSAIFVDYKSSRDRDYSYWLYMIGVICFWLGLTLQNSDSELNKFIYFLINIGLVLFGSILIRNIFVVFGAFGMLGYLGHLSQLFNNEILFSMSAIGFGVLIVYMGIWWNNNGYKVNQSIMNKLPEAIKTKVYEIHK